MIRVQRSSSRRGTVVVFLVLLLTACGDHAPDTKTAAVAVKPESLAPAAKVSPVPAPAKPAPANDAERELARRVKEALHAVPALADAAIDVTTSAGVAHLWGTVGNSARVKLAEMTALKVAGVKSVDNHLAIVSGS